jgi:hypothetical protein
VSNGPESALHAFNALPPGSLTPSHTVLAVEIWSLPAEGIGRVPVTCVLVSGAIGDCAAYAGVGQPAWVSDHGNKLPLALAMLAFPAIDPARYRGA